jgi:hypothetical protein
LFLFILEKKSIRTHQKPKMNDELRAAAKEWCAVDPDPETREYIAGLAAAGGDAEAEELRARLLSGRLVFGTAGLRDKLGAGYNHMNEVCVAIRRGFSDFDVPYLFFFFFLC